MLYDNPILSFSSSAAIYHKVEQFWHAQYLRIKIFRFEISQQPEISALNPNIESDLHEISY